MRKIEILAIPNYYTSYYLYGLSKLFKVNYSAEKEFDRFTNDGIIVFRVEGKIGVIDNRDPVGIDEELYEKADIYWATNKLLDSESYSKPKVRPLFPHYPINILPIYLNLFRFALLKKLSLKDFAREVYIQYLRPKYKKKTMDYFYGDYIFFSGSTWKKEPLANHLRAEFIRACKAQPQIKFEGGLIPRVDGNNFGYDDLVNKVKYSPKKFSELTSKSLVSLNNPAVLGAVSWRLAEIWNSTTFVLSFPFAIDLPVQLEHAKNIHFVNDPLEYEAVLAKVIEDPEYHKLIATGGKAYFDKSCTPEAQASQIINSMLELT